MKKSVNIIHDELYDLDCHFVAVLSSFQQKLRWFDQTMFFAFDFLGIQLAN